MPSSWQKVVYHQFVSRCASHLYRDTFAEVLGSGVVGTPPTGNADRKVVAGSHWESGRRQISFRRSAVYPVLLVLCCVLEALLADLGWATYRVTRNSCITDFFLELLWALHYILFTANIFRLK